MLHDTTATSHVTIAQVQRNRELHDTDPPAEHRRDLPGPPMMRLLAIFFALVAHVAARGGGGGRGPAILPVRFEAL